MKKIFLASLLALMIGPFTFAQPRGGDSERIQQMRVEFFEEELQFTKEESASFWPVYQQFKKDQRSLKASYRTNRKLELMSDAEAEDFIDEHLELEEKQLALKREYIGKLKTVINIRKIAMIQRTERKFKQELLSKIQDRRESKGKRRKFN